MDGIVVVSIISAFASIAVAGITFSLTKKKEREAEWKRQKIEHYKEFLESLSGVVVSSIEISNENHLRWAKSCNTIGLVASQNILTALWEFQNASSSNNPNYKKEDHDNYLVKLILAIRKDLDVSPKDVPETFKFRLWASI